MKSEFGKKYRARLYFRQPRGKPFAHPVGVETYRNEDGFTAQLKAFPTVIGYGETAKLAEYDALNCLIHVCRYYWENENLTDGARRQREEMRRYVP